MKIVQEMTMDEVNQVDGGMADMLAFLLFWAIAYGLEALGIGNIG